MLALVFVFLLTVGRSNFAEEKRGKSHAKLPIKTPRKPKPRPRDRSESNNGHSSFLNHGFVENVQMQTRGTIKMDVTKVSQSPVVVFSAWHTFKNLTQFKPRIDHHVAYTKRHSYTYIIFVVVDMTTEQKAELGDDVHIVQVPGFENRTDMQTLQKPLQTGWLKVEGFKILFNSFKPPTLFFYIDMDVVFHNFNVPISSVFADMQQSIFVQDVGRMFAPSHAVPLRHSPAALRFVEDWANLMPGCPHLNMEQGT